MTDLSIDTIIQKEFVKTLIERTCETHDYEVISRPAAFIIKQTKEDERNINRIIILPPHGYTANTPNQTNCFHGVESATIQIKGSVRKGKRGFSKLKNSLLTVSNSDKTKISNLNKPYLTFDIKKQDPDFLYETHSAGTPPFHVVKTDGTGFYHTLINLTDEWLVLQLHKKMRPQKNVELRPIISSLPMEIAQHVITLYRSIIEDGDETFEKRPNLVKIISQIEPEYILPALGEMLFIRDTGKHETCTAFAMILKIGKKEPEKTLSFLQTALTNQSVPTYFAEQLIQKISKNAKRDIIKKAA